MELSASTKVLVTGGAGFLGSAVVRALATLGVSAIVPRRANHDLLDWQATRSLFESTRPELVIHGAWTGGGIGFSRSHPGTMARDNVLIATHVLEACRQFSVRKFVGIGSVCAYPKFTPVPFREEDLWNGYPEETNAAYGVAKRMMLVLTQSFREEFGLDGVHLLLVNLYGPGDSFDLRHGHVIPAMIRKLLAARESGASEVEMWGDGTPTREFIFVDDAADAIVRAAMHYDSSDPVNIGTGIDISIRDLADKLAHLLGFSGRITWDTSKPNGQPRRRLDVSKAKARFGFEARVDFDEGLRRTVEWYLRDGRKIWER